MKTQSHIVLQSNGRAGFTLLELLIASAISALVILAIYGVFASGLRLRDNAAAHNRATRLETRAAKVIRNDLENIYISGGILASTLQGDSSGNEEGSSFPGYLKISTTGGKDDISGTTSNSGTSQQMYGDVEQVEYYIVKDANSVGQQQSGDLVRVVTRDLLDSTQSAVVQQQILTGVQSFQVSFYDGAQWQPSWMLTGSNAANGGTAGGSGATSGTSATSSAASGTSSSGSNTPATTLPEAIRVDIQLAMQPGATQPPPPITVLVPWVTTPFLSGTNFAVGSDTTTSQ